VSLNSTPPFPGVWDGRPLIFPIFFVYKQTGMRYDDVQSPTIRIKAFWSAYGPRFHHSGKNTDCAGDCDSWTVAVDGLERWIARNHPGKTPVFYGTSAEFAKEEWDKSAFALQ
jgi:hypothetical protein